MSIKRTNSQSYVQSKSNNEPKQYHSGRQMVKDEVTSDNKVLLKKSEKLIQSSKQKRQIPPGKLKHMRQVFTSVSNSQLLPVERLDEALLALDHDPRKDISYQDFLIEHELNSLNETSSGLIDFEHFVLIVLEYEEKLRIEEEAVRRVDLKIAFECFDINKDGMIDTNELSVVMKILGFPITDREAKDMIEFADHDKDSLLSFDEFLTVLTQISAINIS